MLRTVACLACMLVSLSVCATIAQAQSNPSPEEAIAQLNAWRARVGLEPVEHDQEMTAGCRAHAEYYRLNRDNGTDRGRGHGEHRKNPGYTREGDRAASESVLFYGSEGGQGPMAWEEGVYHRASLLDPWLSRTGYWEEHGIACMNVAADDERDRELADDDELMVFTYPIHRQSDVPTSFSCSEMPNPCEMVPGNNGITPTGFILSMQFEGPFSPRQLQRFVASASLAPDGGAPVDLVIEDSTSPRVGHLDDGIALIPVQELRPKTWYTARVEGTVAGEPFGHEWRFRTSGERFSSRRPRDERVIPDPQITVDRFRPRVQVSRAGRARVRVTVTADGPLRGQEASLRILGEMKDFTLSGRDSWTFRVPSRKTKRVRAVVRVGAFELSDGTWQQDSKLNAQLRLRGRR